jgi:hypothetical protein
MVCCWHPASTQRAFWPIVTEREAGCDGRERVARQAGRTRTQKSCGPGLPTLRPSAQERSCDDGGKTARSPGRARRTALTPSRRECRMIWLNLW